MLSTLFLGSCPILLYAPHKLLSGEIGQIRLWCNFHDHHQRAGLPSDAVPLYSGADFTCLLCSHKTEYCCSTERGSQFLSEELL